jgi:hypothetical protein
MNAARTSRQLTPLTLGLVAALALGCSHSPEATNRCQSDDACGAGNACSSGTCLPRAAPPASWSVALTPRSDSTAAYTELASVAMPADAFDLTATPKVTLQATLAFDGSAAPFSAAHVVLAVPSTIAGLPDLQFETDLAPPVDSATPTPPPSFTLPIPKGVVGRAGTLRMLPGAPDNATHAPSTFTVVVAPTLSLPIAAKSFTVSGRLLSAVGDPLAGLLARAFVGGNLVSNVSSTMMDGSFSVMVPADATATSLAVEVEPPDSNTPAPHFWAKPFPLTADVDLGVVQLPAYGQPVAFGFPVQGDTTGDPAVVGALVRARTLLADDQKGTTDYLRDGLTDMTGQASLALLPGSTSALRPYDVAVVPPADSIFAITCLEGLGLATGAIQAAIQVHHRPVFTGTVVGADGTPVAGVAIQATRTGGPTTACDDYASAPQTTGTTKADGTFTLHLDAGIYTLDFDPPAGAPYPRLTQTGVQAAMGGDAQTVQLAPGAVVEGTLLDSSGQPLPQAGVRFYGPACAAPATCPQASPVLEAQARADANGHYRMIIPTP